MLDKNKTVWQRLRSALDEVPDLTPLKRDLITALLHSHVVAERVDARQHA